MAKRALIIANEEYDDPRFAPLPGAGADADGLSAVLRDPTIGEFDVTVVRNGRAEDVRVAVAKLLGTASNEDTVLLHISAHGRKDTRGRLYFVATNTQLDYLGATGVSAAYVNEQIDDSMCRRVVVLLDCCYSGAFTRGMRTRGEGSVEVAEPFNGRGRVVITASTSLQFSHEQEASSRTAAQPSVFTRAVIDGLRSGAADIDADGYVSADDLYRYIYDEVRRTIAAQTPTRSVDRVEGTLVLARNPVHLATTAVEPGVPAEIQAAVAARNGWERIGALHELGRLLASVRDTTRQTALELVQLIAADTDPEVAGAARRLLIDRGMADQIPTAEAPQRKPQAAATTFTLGIDFGTTNSVVAAFIDGDVQIIPNREGGRSTPSCVSFTADGQILAGDPAARQSALHPETTVHGVKLRLGSDWTVAAHGLTYTAEQVASMVLRKLRVDAEEYLHGSVGGAIITVPAYFTHIDRESLAEAAALADLPLLRTMNEPTAAAIAYGIDKVERDQIIAVLDLGGGTCDVSIMELGEGVLETKATGGDLALGGNDWDARIVEHLATRFHDEHQIDLHSNPATMQRLREAAEKAKIELSAVSVSNILLPYIATGPAGPLHLDTTLTRAQFEEFTRDLVNQCRQVFATTAAYAEETFWLSTDHIDHVVLVGGASRMPAIIDLARELGQGREPSRAIIPEGVAAGAAVQAAILKGTGPKEGLLLDVTPLSLGVAIRNDAYEKLVANNTTIPAKRSDVFTTWLDNQHVVEFHIYQGNHDVASRNVKLATLTIDNLPPAPRHVPQLEFTVDVDANGVVHASIKDLGTGREETVTISRESVRQCRPENPSSLPILNPEPEPPTPVDRMT